MGCGISYADAKEMPLPIALAFLNSYQHALSPKRQANVSKSRPQIQTKKYVATRRKKAK